MSLAVALPAFAVKEWYDHYTEARDRLLPAGRYDEALKALQEAIRLKPTSGLNERTYGLTFENYLPYYQMGLCYMGLSDFNSAIRFFNIEEKQGAIRRDTTLQRELIRKRQEAEDLERQRLARVQRAEADRLLREAAELRRTRRYEDALARLAQAQKAAENLDVDTQRQVAELRQRVADEMAGVAESAARAKRIDEALSEARRLLEADALAEAVVRFDVVLELDPAHPEATSGKREAQQRIRASQTRAELRARLQEGKALLDAGRAEDALRPLTEAAADPVLDEARELLARAQKAVEGLRVQRELQAAVDARMAEGELLLAARKWPEAQVRFEAALRLDAGNARARERLSFAERMTGEALFARFMPNQPPLLAFFEPRQAQLELRTPTVAVVGVASDDRAVERVEFSQGGRSVGQVVPAPRPDFQAQRNVRFEKVLELKPGANTISVTAFDAQGVSVTETFEVTRRLRFHETEAFLPAAAASALALVGIGFGVQRARRSRAVRRRFNPYIAGAPVREPDMFYGREKLMARILNVLHHNSLMITGERRIGKTSFLYHLRRRLADDTGSEYQFFPVLVDLQGVSEADFFHSAMGDVVDGLALSPEAAAGLRFRPEQDEYDGRDFSHDLQRLVEELKKRTTRKVKLALLIDEVDVLNEFSERVNQRLRSIFMKTFSEHLVAVMSGVGIRRSWKSEGSPWYNFFDEVEITPLSREDAEALVREPVEDFFSFQPDAVQAILEASSGRPYLIQKLCIHAVNRMLEAGRTTIERGDVDAVSPAVLADHESPAPGARAVAD